MSKSDSETSVTKSTPVIIQHKSSSFNSRIVLNETNYDLWSQMLEMKIAEKEKLSFIRGTSPPLKEKDEDYEKWYSNNQKVKMVANVYVPGDYETIHSLTYRMRYLESSV